MSFIDSKGDLISALTQRPEISHLEKYIEKYGEKFAKEFDILVLELDLSEKISKKIISSFNKNNKKIFIYSANLTEKYADFSLFSNTECVVLSEKSAGVLLGTDINSLEFHQIQKNLKRVYTE